MDLDELRWRTVVARERPQAGQRPAFLYGVTTTGVFCTPGCPSPRPDRANVRFFDTAQQAVEAGLRACLRCRPEPGGTPRKDAVAVERVGRACAAMLEAGGPVTAPDLARLLDVSSRQLGRDFQEQLALSPRAFGQAVRNGHARRLLQTHERVVDAVFAAGFGSTRGFYETTAPTLGMSPADYAAGGAGQVLRWTSTRTPVGTVLVVAGDLGLCQVHVGEQETVLLAQVQAELPGARFVRADLELAETAAALTALASGAPADARLPLAVTGTAFQARVWSALQRIPAGQTRSYAAVAADVGAPGSARAVARACATNRLALVIPCHRVVRSDGSLSGYRWGLAVKQQLLDLETAHVPA